MSNKKTIKWESTFLGDILTFQRGFDITKKEQKTGSYNVYSSSGPNSTHDKFKIKGPGVIIGRKGSLGTVFFSPNHFWPHDTTLWIKDFHGNHSKFAYYFLKNMHLEKFDCGASNPTLNRNHIHKLIVNLPPLPTQRKIAAILSTYDDLIENNNRRIKILEEMAQGLYREWFVEFRFPGHEDVVMVEARDGRMVPEGWEYGKLGDRIELAYGKALKAAERKGGDISVFGSSGIIGWHDTALVQEPGIIVGRKGNVGSVYWSDTKFYAIDTVYYVKTDIPLHYIYFNLQHQNFINNDAAVPGLNRKQAYSLPLLIPEASILAEFEKITSNFFAIYYVIKQKIGNLKQSRDLLLPRLIEGEIDVSELKIPV